MFKTAVFPVVFLIIKGMTEGLKLPVTPRSGGEMIPHENLQKKRWEYVSVFHLSHPPSTHLYPQQQTKSLIITWPIHNAASGRAVAIALADKFNAQLFIPGLRHVD